MSKILTIVVPSYNMEAYLGKCLDSLIVKNADGTVDGTLMDALEVLVINDGSKDRTSDIGHSYEAKYPGTFRVIDKANGHYGSCVNRGLAEAKGTFIRVLDADDYVVPSRFFGFMQLLCSFEPSKLPDAVITDYEYVDTEGTIQQRCQFPHLPSNDFFSFESIENVIQGTFQNHDLTYRTAIPRSIAYHQTEGILYSDAEWFILPMTQVEHTYYYPEAVVQYLVGREGQSVSPSIRMRNIKTFWEVSLGIVKKLEELSPSAKPSGLKFARERTRQFLSNRYYDSIFQPKACYHDFKEQLIKYDYTLKDISPFFYEEIAQTAVIKRNNIQLYFIREWRKRYSTRTMNFLLFNFIGTLCKYYKKIKARLHINTSRS